MKITNQTNSNEGDVYNIEKINQSMSPQHLDIRPYLVQKSIIHKETIDRYNIEKTISIVVGGVGFSVDIFDISSNFNLAWWLWILVFISIFLFLYFRHFDVYGLSSKKSIQIPYSVTNEIIIKQGHNFLVNKSEAPCMYPNCDGIVEVIDTPVDFKGPHNLMGQCSLAGLQHGYLVDNNLQAYPADIHNEFNEKA